MNVVKEDMRVVGVSEKNKDTHTYTCTHTQTRKSISEKRTAKIIEKDKLQTKLLNNPRSN